MSIVAKGANIMTPLYQAPPVFPDSPFISARVRVTRDCITIPAGSVVGGTLLATRLPSQAIILPESRVYWEALGAGVTLDFGAANDADGLMSAVDAAAAGSASALEARAVGEYDWRLWKALAFTEDPLTQQELYFTIGGATVAAAKKVFFSILYTDD